MSIKQLGFVPLLKSSCLFLATPLFSSFLFFFFLFFPFFGWSPKVVNLLDEARILNCDILIPKSPWSYLIVRLKKNKIIGKKG